jgi:predicted nuclease of predicted toxin-antitoxin system
MPSIRILLDNNVPIRLIPPLRPHAAVHASQVGWAALGNGDLIRAAEDHGYPVLVTSDQNIRHQQNLTRRQFCIIELSTTRWPTIRDNVASLLAAIETMAPGSYTTVTFAKSPLRRRPYPGGTQQ